MAEGLRSGLVLVWLFFLKIQVLGCLNTPQAACPSCDLLNACDLESSSVLESVIVENVTCNPLSLHSAGQVIDFQKKKKN